MKDEYPAGQIPVNKQDAFRDEVLAEQVRQLYALAPYGFLATLVNSVIVFFVMRGAMQRELLTAWLIAIQAVTALRIATVLQFRSGELRPAAARTWGNRFVAGLVVSGIVWGSIAAFPLSEISMAHQVFIAFVLGGMAAGAAATYSVAREGYLAYSAPALIPLAIRFFLIDDMFHYTMGGMLSLYGLLLWRISRRHYIVNSTSLLLRFENRDMVENLKNAKEHVEELYKKLLLEIDAKQKAEAELRAQQGRLEKTVEERTMELVRANEQLKVEIEERRQTEQELWESREKIMHLAHHDALTDLPNRRLFMDLFTIELAQARRNRRRLALLFLDLDRFKEINDTFGHDAGDELLKEVSKRLKASIRESDVAARIGGDEFNIILTDITRSENITSAMRKIMDSLERPFVIAGYELHVTVSIGISVYPDDSDQMDTLYRYADIAMYHAKEGGRNTFQYYNPDINNRSIEKIKFESYLRQAIARGEFVVHYQPQFDIKKKSIVCAEALVRWQHPELGMLEPKRFITLAEETGLINSIDEWVLKTACSQVKAWLDSGLLPVCITVNLSAREFRSPGMADNVSRILKETDLPANYLDIEITESLAMSNIEHTIAQLNELTARGIRISIDDFGTGYSSLSHLKRLPVQKLKIDQSFIRDIVDDPDDRAIINAVTALAHSMKIKVIAEGVETEGQLSFLRETQCDEAQGYLFGRPVPADEFRDLIAAGLNGARS